jgi:hypothetical protein
MAKASLIKRIVSLCFICIRKHDNTEETYKDEQDVINEIIDEFAESHTSS